jgi:hypothetical protein
MSGEEVETSQADVDLKALEGFLAGNGTWKVWRRCWTRTTYFVYEDRLRGRGVEACPRRGGDRDLYAMRCVEQCRLLKAERDGYGDGLCCACVPHASGSSHHLSRPLLRHHHHFHIHI